nr:MAG TPA: hypothetical protein [Caudoviricetes sp.]
MLHIRSKNSKRSKSVIYKAFKLLVLRSPTSYTLTGSDGAFMTKHDKVLRVFPYFQ